LNEELETAVSIITTSYLRTEDLIRSVKENIPSINKIDGDGNAKIVIKEELKIKLPESERMLLDMFDKGAFAGETAVSLKTFCKGDIQSALKNGLLKQVDKKYCLTTEGIISAARYAEERAERVITLNKKQTAACIKPIEIDEWDLEEKWENIHADDRSIVIKGVKTQQSILSAASSAA
jgi:hypothetical protein